MSGRARRTPKWSWRLATTASSALPARSSTAVALWRAYQRGGWLGWLLPITLVATAATQVYLLANYPDYRAWIAPIALGAALIAAAALVWLRLRNAPTSREVVAVVDDHEPLV